MEENKRLNDLLRWSIENTPAPGPNGAAATNGTSNGTDGPAPGAQAPPATNLTPEMLEAIMGGPSEADLMRAAMEVISSDDAEAASLDDKLIAFDNLEQLIENLDNANNMANLGLWTPLLAQLGSAEPSIRRMAAWCVGTAVQNNERTQERVLAAGGLPPLVAIALGDDEQSVSADAQVRRKAVYALSSACRNYQPAMDLCAEELAKRGMEVGKVDAADMAAVDVVMDQLRDKAMAGPATAPAS